MIKKMAFATLAVAAVSCSGEPAEERATGGEQEVEAAAVPAAVVNAVRLLEQMTFGARPALPGQSVPTESIEHVTSIGAGAAIIEQLDRPAELFEPTPPRAAPCDGAFPPELEPGAQFFVDALTSSDQLRLRVMFALSQILVVSTGGINELSTTCNSEKRDAMVRYLNALRGGAFGSYRELLEKITLEPAMGTYLDMANNVGVGPAGPITPNENFARELLQLFTVGTYRLDDRGERVLVGGNPVPAYSEAQVMAFARTFTGWTYPHPDGCPTTIGGKRGVRYDGPMIPCDINHNKTSQQLLTYAGAVNGGKTTAGATARQHMEQALDNVFNHPNLPPFVCKQLIQHLVTSNPSPEYVARVVAVFKDDGSAVHRRGNLRAVVRTILADPEARTAPVAESYGRLRAPAELLARFVRGLAVQVDVSDGKNPGQFLNARSGFLGQTVPQPPSVFSYYPPEQPAPGQDLLGPEFGLLNTYTITQRLAVLQSLMPGTFTASAGLDMSAGLAAMPDDPTAMVDWIDKHFLHGAMSTGPTGLRTTLLEALADTRAGDASNKKRLALTLTFLSPELEIQR